MSETALHITLATIWIAVVAATTWLSSDREWIDYQIRGCKCTAVTTYDSRGNITDYSLRCKGHSGTVIPGLRPTVSAANYSTGPVQ